MREGEEGRRMEEWKNELGGMEGREVKRDCGKGDGRTAALLERNMEGGKFA